MISLEVCGTVDITISQQTVEMHSIVACIIIVVSFMSLMHAKKYRRAIEIEVQDSLLGI